MRCSQAMCVQSPEHTAALPNGKKSVAYEYEPIISAKLGCASSWLGQSVRAVERKADSITTAKTHRHAFPMSSPRLAPNTSNPT